MDYIIENGSSSFLDLFFLEVRVYIQQSTETVPTSLMARDSSPEPSYIRDLSR